MTDYKPLTAQQDIFVATYLEAFKITDAAEAAGVSYTTGLQWMKDPRILADIAEGKRKVVLRAEISADQTLERLNKIVEADITVVLKALFAEGGIVGVTKALAELPDDVRFAIKSVEWTRNGPKVTMHDKVQSLMAIGKYFKLFVDKFELTGPNGGPVETIDHSMTPEKAQQAYADMLKGQKEEGK